MGPDLVLIIFLAVWIAAALLVMAVYLALRPASSAERRLMELRQHVELAEGPNASVKLKEMLFQLLSNLSRGLAKGQQVWQLNQLKRDLMSAGYTSNEAVSLFLGIKVALTFLVPVLVLLSPLRAKLDGPMILIVPIMAALLGFLMPNLILGKMISARTLKINKELPGVLDLLVIAVEAGLGLDAAMRRVALELSISAPVLARELTMVSLELKVGIPRAQALKNLAARCGAEEVSTLVSMLIQADRFGVSIGRSLRVHSDSVRDKRRQKIEEDAAKIPLKLLFPVLFLIFPAILAAMLGPAIIKIGETMM